MPGGYLWGWDTAAWKKVLVDLAGHLQVDVVTSGLPAGGATAANQALIIADTGTLVTEQGRCYGWDLANWQPLRVESALLHNLRVRLYAGATAIDAAPVNNNLTTQTGLVTKSTVMGRRGVNDYRPIDARQPAADGVDTTPYHLMVSSHLYGYNGTTWDRLRTESNTAFNLRVAIYAGATQVLTKAAGGTSITDPGLITASMLYAYDKSANFERRLTCRPPADAVEGAPRALYTAALLHGFNGIHWNRARLWGTNVLKVGRAEVGLLDVRMTGTGQVGAVGARRLYWMLLNPGAGNSVVELTDAIAAGAAVKADHFDTARDGHMITFDPPLEFSNGIYLETFTNLTSIIFGYL